MSYKHRPGDDDGRRAERTREIALFRYALIRAAADPALGTRQRGLLVRELAAAEHAGSSPSARTLQRHFARLELNTRPDGSTPAAFGRFEAAAPNDRWTGDALHGPVVAGRKTYLFAFIDDHSRTLTGYRWGHSEDTLHLAAALRAGLSARGIPKVVYLDYADLRIMPTSTRMALPGRRSVLARSA